MGAQKRTEVPSRHVRAAAVPRWVRFFNPIARRLLEAGIPMGFNALITVRGRKTGLPRTTPVTIIETGGRRWVMAPFGEVDWVRNLRAGSRAIISARRRKEEVIAMELNMAARVDFFRDVLGPLVRQYGPIADWIVRNIDKVDIKSPAEAAIGRPVFELLPVQGEQDLQPLVQR